MYRDIHIYIYIYVFRMVGPSQGWMLGFLFRYKCKCICRKVDVNEGTNRIYMRMICRHMYMYM